MEPRPRHRIHGILSSSALITVLGWPTQADGDQERPGTLIRNLGGIPDPAASNGEATTRDKPGIYCWWRGPKVRPGYFEVIARARRKGARGVLHFVLTDATDDKHHWQAVTKVRRGWIESREYREVHCGTFYWDGSFTPRVSDWSSPGLMVDWVKLVPVKASDVRDPLPGQIKRYDAPRFGESPQIDGDLAEWVRVPRLLLGEDSARSASYRGTADLSAACQFAWDATHLYFACEVTDDCAEFLDDARMLSRIWKYDSIQVAFDAAGNARTPGYQNDDYEYGFGLTATGAKAYRWVAGHHLPVGDVPSIDAAVVRDETERLTRYEVAIPFKELVPFSPTTQQCGMTLIVNDRDGGRGQSAWLEWTPGIAGAKDPSAFGVLRLADAPPSAGSMSATLICERDLSGKATTTVSLRVRAPDPLGDCDLRWSVSQGEGQPVLRQHQSVTIDGDEASFPFAIDLTKLGQGRFAVSAELRREGKTAAAASTRFFRFEVDELELQLAAIRERLTTTLKQIETLRAKGLHAQYPRATLGAVEEFVRYTDSDLKKAFYERAGNTMEELEDLLDDAQAEIAQIEADPSRDLAAPPPPKTRITAREGTFYCGDEPQLLIGYCGWWRVWTGVHRLAAQGLNHLQDSIIAPFALFPKSGHEPDKKMIEGLRWGWDKADRAGVCYSRMLACNQLAKSFREKHPEATGGGWSDLCTLHPAVRDFQKRYLTTVARTAKPHPSLGVHVLYGENRHKLTGHPLEVAAFKEHLQQRYRTLGALNAVWHTQFKKWDEIGSAPSVPSPVAWHDRGRFSQHLFTRWSAWLQEQVRAVDPNALCTGYPSLLSWDDSSDFSSGIDMEALCRTFNVNGFDTASLEYGGKRWAMTSIAGFAMLNDLAKAFNPANPNFDPELHLVNLNQRYPEAYIRAAMFQGCLHGLAAASLWVFQRNEGMDSMLVFQPRVMAAYIRTGLDLRRLTEPILAFQKAPSEVAILYSLTSVAYNPKHLPEMRAAYEGTFFSDTKVSFVTERTVMEGALNRLKLLIVPSASHVPVPVAKRITTWTGRGGRLVLFGECLTRNERNQALPRPSQDAAGIVRLPATADPQAYSQALEPILAKTVRRPYRAATDGVEMRTAATDRGRLFYAINMNKAPVTLDLSPRPQGALAELRTQRPVRLPLRLAPLQVVVIALAKVDFDDSPVVGSTIKENTRTSRSFRE